MKRISFIIVLCSICVLVSAQGRYRHGVGAVVGSVNGFSYKTFFSENFCLEADAIFGLQRTIAGVRIQDISAIEQKDDNIWTVTINPNFLYQKLIQTWDWGGISVLGGGGLSLGCMSEYNLPQSYVFGKFGINSMVGAELGFDETPMTIQLDFRPGYGLGFRSDDGIQKHISFFDWALALGIRYVF